MSAGSEHLAVALCFGIEPSILFSYLFEFAAQGVDSFQALVQHQFQPADRARFVFQFAAQAANGCARAIEFSAELGDGGAGAVGPGHLFASYSICVGL